MASRFRYEPRSAESVKSRINQTSGDYDSYLKVPQWKIAEGNHTIRILPRTWDKTEWGDNWGIQVWVHNRIGPDNGSYLCLAKMKGEDCPLCEAASQLSRENAYEIKAKKRVLVWIIDRDDEKAGPKIWNTGWKNEQELQTQQLDPRTGAVVNIEDPNKGFDIDFVRRGTGPTNTTYGGWRIARKSTYLHDKESKQEAWLDYISENPLPSMLRYYDADYLEKVFAGKGRSKDEDEDDRPSRRKRDEDDDDDRPRRSNRDEDEDDRPSRRRRDDDDDRKSDEDDDRPSRRKRNDDDDDRKDDDDDNRPSRKRRDDDDDDRRGSKRDRKSDEDEDDRPSRRKRDDDDDDDRKSDRRGSRRDEDEDDRPSRRRRDDDDDDRSSRRDRDEDEDRPSRRKRDEDDDKESEEDESVSRARKTVNKLKDEKKGGGQKRR